ncbi:MAG: AmmeMemoRadiSam system protein B [Planctomycetia bacterium]|nr:AmmeMemoRadiSam system protein B [Planctomycetia bacterium]
MPTPSRPRVRPLEAFPAPAEAGGDGAPRFVLRDPEGLFDGLLLVTPAVLDLLRRCDGTHTPAAIADALASATGARVPRGDVEALLDELATALVLEGPAVEAARAAALAAYRAAPARAPACAGASYPDEPAACRRFLDDALEAAGDLDLPDRVRAVLAPHIDLRGGGPCHGAAARALARCAADTFVVLGTAHAPLRRPFALTTRDFATPVGTVRTDRDLVARLAARGGGGLLDDELAHREEHSVEFQALWLAHLFAGRRDVTIVPVLVGSLHARLADGRPARDDARVADFVDALTALVDDRGDRVAVVASVDLAHVGPKYGDDAPVTPARLAEVLAADRVLLEHAAAVAPDAWLRALHAERDARNVCGAAPTWALLEALRGRGLAGTVLRHDAWEIDPATASHVSFAAVAYA